MSNGADAGPETPFDRARRMHAHGATANEVEAALTRDGLSADDARIAARAARGEAGAPFAALDDAHQTGDLPSEPPAIAPSHPCPKHPTWPVLAPCARCGSFYCPECLREAGRRSTSDRCAACQARDELPQQGIGGWLVLPALGLVVMPLALGAGIVQDLQALSSPLMDGLVPPIALELIFNVALLGLGLTAAVAFFRRKKKAIGLMVAMYAAGLAVAVIDMGISDWVQRIVGQGGADAASVTGSGRQVITSLIWIAYFLQSKRVKATFVND